MNTAGGPRRGVPPLSLCTFFLLHTRRATPKPQEPVSGMRLLHSECEPDSEYHISVGEPCADLFEIVNLCFTVPLFVASASGFWRHYRYAAGSAGLA